MYSLDKHLLQGRFAAVSPWVFAISSALAAIGLSALLLAFVENPARRRILRPRSPVEANPGR
jgi:peptidoglycan/LPS O-acetylase OafA/YrhL